MSFLKERGLALVNTRKLPLVEAISGMMSYPENRSLFSIPGNVTDRVVSIDATSLAEEIGDSIDFNRVMIGTLTSL